MYKYVVLLLFICNISYAVEVQTVTANQLHNMLLENDVCLIDVRNTDEYIEEHIEGSKNIPLPILSLDQMEANNKNIVIHCKSGKRGEKAYKLLKSQKPDLQLSNLEGGILSWKAADFPTKVISSTLPIMRQVQILAGTLIVIGTVCSFLSPYFLAIPAFVGCGLMFAGFSGWCGMANLLSLMPWNN
jgi:rhodanese-related sulfurtransferase